MNKERNRLWLIVIVFISVGIVVAVAYPYLRGAEVQVAAGRRQYDAGQFKLAEASFERATQRDPERVDAWYWLGMSRKNQGKGQAAANALAKATSLDPQPVDVWMEYAEALEWAGKPREARQAWKEVIERLDEDDGRMTYARRQLARIMAGQGQHDEAINMLKQMLAEDESSEVRLTLAQVLAWAGRFEESAEQYRMGLASQPEQ